MINKLKPKSEFSRNVLTLMTGTTIAQAIPIAISPILTRIYTPEDFGVFALYISTASLISIIATGRYELAIMLPKKDSDAINIVALSIFISFFISFIALLVVIFFNTQITNLLGSPKISNWLYFIPFTILFTGLYQSFNYWINRKKKYKTLAKNRVLQKTTESSINLIGGFLRYGSGGLILGNILGQLSAVIFLFKNSELRSFYNSVTKLKIYTFVKIYKKLPIFNLPNAFIDNVRVSGINILINHFFSSAILGQFSLAWRLVQAPMSIVGSSISQVFFQKVSSSKNNTLYNLVVNFIKKAVIIALPLFLLLYIFAPKLFAFIFGKEWTIAGDITSALSPWLFLNFISSPLSTVFIKLNKQDIMLMFSIIYMIVPLSILYFFHSYHFLELMKILSLSMSLLLFVFIYLVLFYTKKELKYNE